MFFIHFYINMLSSVQKTFSFIHQIFVGLITLIPHRSYQLFFKFINVFIYLILVIEVGEYMHLQLHFSKLFLQIIVKPNLKLPSMLTLYITIIIILNFLSLFLLQFFFPRVIPVISELFNSLIHFYVHHQFML